jgi:hypothetical protein
MIPLFSYIDELPPVPVSLYSDILESIQINLGYVTGKYYFICEAKKNIYNWVHSVFDPAVYDYNMVNVQSITGNGKIHVDGRRNVLYNFLIEQGNPGITTTWYEDQEGTKPIESHIIQPFRWCRLKSDQWHDYTGVNPGDRRLSLCVFKTFDHLSRYISN